MKAANKLAKTMKYVVIHPHVDWQVWERIEEGEPDFREIAQFSTRQQSIEYIGFMLGEKP